MKKRAVLFDLDGTLTDSMHLHYTCWEQLLTRYGVSLKKIDFFCLEGTNIYSLMSQLTKITDPELIEYLVREKDIIFHGKYKFNLFPGVVELMDYLQMIGLPFGLVTASSRKRLNNTMPKDFLDQFACIVTSDDLSVGKPSPEVYFEGARRLNIHPNHILAIENAPLGVKSAIAAGMRCLVVGNTLPRSYFPENSAYFKSMKLLLRSLENEIT